MDLPGADEVVTARSYGKIALQRARRDGATQRVWRGIDVAAEGTGFGRLRATATLHPGAVLSGPSALRLFRFDVPDDWPEEITVPVAIRPRPGLRVRSGALPATAVLVHRGLRATTPTQAVAAVLRLEAPSQALWVCDQALGRGIEPAALRALWLRGMRGARVGRSVLALGDRVRESALEARVRWVLSEYGVPAPVCQRPEPRAAARLDFAWPDARVALEADGARWHGAPAPLHRDRVRQNALATLGWLVLRCTWADAVERPSELAAAVLAALASRST